MTHALEGAAWVLAREASPSTVGPGELRGALELEREASHGTPERRLCWAALTWAVYRERGERHDCPADGGHAGGILVQRGDDPQVL